MLLLILFLLPTTARAFNIFSEREDGVPSTPSFSNEPRYFTFASEDIFNSQEYQLFLRRHGIMPFTHPIENKTYLNESASRAKIARQKAAAAMSKKPRAIVQKTKHKRSLVFLAKKKRKPSPQKPKKNNVRVKKAQWR